MKPYKQTLYVIWGNQLLFLFSIVYAYEWYLIPLGILSMYIFGAFSEIGMHRYFSHKSFKTTNFKEKILRVFAFLAGQGSILSWAIIHRNHHKYADTINDPHSPLFLPKWKIYLLLISTNHKNNLIFDLMRSKSWKYYQFENTYYYIIWSILWVVSFITSFTLFYFIVSGAALWYIATTIINIAAHDKSVGTVAYPDASATNSNVVNLLTAAGHHNNHHKFPASYTYSINGELDIYGWIIKHVFIKKNIS